MGTERPIMGADDVIAAALRLVKEQQEKLQALLEEAEESSRACVGEQAQIREDSAAVARLVETLETKLAAEKSGELAIELVSLRAEQRAMEQQENRLDAEASDLVAASQRLQLAVRGTGCILSLLTAEDAIRDNDTSRDNLDWRVAQAREEERERIAREIHDGPAQALANAIFELEFCERLMERDRQRLRDELLRLKSDMREALGDLRHFMFGLRPAVLSDLGLAATLRRYTEEYRARCGVAVDLEIDDEIKLSATQEVAVFRIIQEALQNTRKHAKASRVFVRIHEEVETLEIRIQDDGEGFDLGEATERQIGHFGIRGMRERAGLIGAQLGLWSAPGEGTRVTLEIPLAGK